MRHAFVAKQAMFALLMLSFKLDITDKNFEPNRENFKSCPGDGVEMIALWGPHSTGALLLFGKLAQEKNMVYSRKVLSSSPFDSEMVLSGAGIQYNLQRVL